LQAESAIQRRDVSYTVVFGAAADREMPGCFRDVSETSMRIGIAIAALVALLAAGSARAEDNKACISKATESLPHISGLTVKKARTRPVPPAMLATWQGQTRPIMVDLDTIAGDTVETYSYMCVMTKGAAFVRRVMS
jgi:hypothetical protein